MSSESASEEPRERPASAWRAHVALFALGALAPLLALTLARLVAGNLVAAGGLRRMAVLAALFGAVLGALTARRLSERLGAALLAGSPLGVLLVVLLPKLAPAGPVSGRVLLAATLLALALVVFGIALRALSLRVASPLSGAVSAGAGAAAGTLAFLALAWLELPPWPGLLVAIPLLALADLGAATLARRAAPLALLLVAALLALEQDLLLLAEPAAEGELEVRWSPYQKVERFVPAGEERSRFFVDGVPVPAPLTARLLPESCPAAVHLARRTPRARVLVLGAGLGDEVAAALAHGAARVDAVELDPVLAELGRRHHPLRPFADARAALAIGDPGAFLQRAPGRYDLIVVGATRPAPLGDPERARRELLLAAAPLLGEGGELYLCLETSSAATRTAPPPGRTIFKRADREGVLVDARALAAQPLPARADRSLAPLALATCALLLCALALVALGRRVAAPTARPAPEPSRRRLALILFGGLLGVYNLNGDFLPAADAIPSGYLAASLLEEGDLSFTPAEVPFMFREWGRRRSTATPSKAKDGEPLSIYQERYYLVPTIREGVFASTFGPGPTIAALPVFALIRLTHGNLAGHPAALWYGGKLAASLFVAGSAVFLFLSALLFVRARAAFLIAAAYGLGTCVWSISSQALWQHGPNELFLAIGSYCFLRHRERSRFALLSGLAFAAAVCCRPSSAVVAAIVGAYLLITNRRALAAYVAGGLPLALLLALYNLHHFGSLVRTGQGIRGPSVALAKTGLADVWQTPLWQGLLGLLASPSRGLLIFSPFLAFALWGAVRLWRKPGERAADLQVLTLAAASMLLIQFKWFDWWGGHTYGYRPIVDTMPLLALFLVAAIEPIRRSRILSALFGALLTWAVAVQALGAFAYNERDWNTQRTEVRAMAMSDLSLSYGVRHTSRAANIDDARFRHRLWSIRDSTILHHLRFFRSARRLKKAVVQGRLTMAFLPTLAALPVACTPPLSTAVEGLIDLGTEQSHEYLRSGWSASDELDAGRTVRWAIGRTASLQVSLSPRAGDRELVLVARPMRSEHPQRVVVDVNGAYVGRVTMSPGWERYRLLVPKGLLRPGPNRIELRHEWCIQPRSVDPTSRDARQLAAAYDEIELSPLGRSPDELEVAFGTTRARERLALSGGVDASEDSGLRSFVRVPGPAPSFRFALARKASRYLLVVEARADGPAEGGSSLRVSLNDAEVGSLLVERAWKRRALTLPASRLREGINSLRLIPTSPSQPDTLISKLQLRPLRPGASLDLGVAAARRHLGDGWSSDSAEGGRSVVWSDGASSRIELELLLEAPGYLLTVQARAFEGAAPVVAAVSLNGQYVGELSFSSAWSERSLAIPRARLRDGLNRLELSYSRTVRPTSLAPGSEDNRQLALIVDGVSLVASGR
jgi:hypothetical protein